MSATAAIISGIAGLSAAGINAAASAGTTRQARKENYHYNELSAEQADLRTRALYNDLYSPGAQLQQLKNAGLSPSLMYQDGGGISGQAGAQGQGTAGPVPNPFYLDPVTMAQTANIIADTKLKEAEAKNKNVDTERQEIAKQVDELKFGQFKYEFEILDSHFNINGQNMTLQELANNSKNEEEFIDKYREYNPDINAYQFNTLRSIYKTNKEFNNDIAILGTSELSAQFQRDIIATMKKSDFAELNKDAALGYLKANIQTAELTETQKQAWNNLINKIGDKNDTTRDIVVALGMILNNAASNWRFTNVTNNQSGQNVINNQR